MGKRRRPGRRAIILFCIFSVAAFIGIDFYYRFVYPMWILRSLCDRMMQGEELPPNEVRQAMHKVLAYPGYHHDAYIYLITTGDETSVPILVNSLKWQPRSPDGGMI